MHFIYKANLEYCYTNKDIKTRPNSSDSLNSCIKDVRPHLGLVQVVVRGLGVGSRGDVEGGMGGWG